MNINRNNYEEFFMLYADNELSAAEKKGVDAFIAANPDLQQELDLFTEYKLSPDEGLVFTDKQSLIKPEAGKLVITAENYESFLVLYTDGELTHNEKADVEEFIYRQPQLQPAFELLQQARLVPDTRIVFENKESLLRKDDDDRVVPFRWWRLAAAAMVLLVAGITWIYMSKRNNQQDLITAASPAAIQQLPVLPKPNERTAAGPNSNDPQGKEAIAAATPAAQPVKKERPVNTVAARKAINHKESSIEAPMASLVNETPAALETNAMKGTPVSSIDNPANKAVINTAMAAAADKAITDRQLTISGQHENNEIKAEWASSASNDNVELLNTSVNTKNSMRGFLRKASRLIAKKTSLSDEDGNRRGILIGGFEIAVR